MLSSLKNCGVYITFDGGKALMCSLLEFLGVDGTTGRARSGPCTIRDGCIQSPNYPENYSQMLKSMVYNNTAVQEDEKSSVFIS